jgi:hypothetical protein
VGVVVTVEEDDVIVAVTVTDDAPATRLVGVADTVVVDADCVDVTTPTAGARDQSFTRLVASREPHPEARS